MYYAHAVTNAQIEHWETSEPAWKVLFYKFTNLQKKSEIVGNFREKKIEFLYWSAAAGLQGALTISDLQLLAVSLVDIQEIFPSDSMA